jgi:Uma2 family endonuclease
MFLVKFYRIPLSERCNKAQNEVDILCYLNIYALRTKSHSNNLFFSVYIIALYIERHRKKSNSCDRVDCFVINE